MKILAVGFLAVLLLVGGFFGCAFSKRSSMIAQDERVISKLQRGGITCRTLLLEVRSSLRV